MTADYTILEGKKEFLIWYFQMFFAVNYSKNCHASALPRIFLGHDHK